MIYGLVEVAASKGSTEGLRVVAEKLRLLLRVLSAVRFRQALVFVNDDLMCVRRIPYSTVASPCLEASKALRVSVMVGFSGTQLAKNLKILGVEAVHTR